MELSKRLKAVASLVTPGNRVADVGCDHGYVPIWLVKNGIIPSAIAADIKEGPLSRARMHIEEAGLEKKIETRLGDGLEPFVPDEAECLILSGIGGLLLIRLLSRQRETAHRFRELILSPQSDLEQVRRFLVKDGYTIRREVLVREDRKFYFIFYAVPEADGREWKEEEYLFGRDYAPESAHTAVEYLASQIHKQDRILARLALTAPEEHDRTAEIGRERELAVRRIYRLLEEKAKAEHAAGGIGEERKDT